MSAGISTNDELKLKQDTESAQLRLDPAEDEDLRLMSAVSRFLSATQS